MRSDWTRTTWGQLATLEYGKALRGYQDVVAPFRVFGTNGPVGWHSQPLCDGPGVIIGRKGAYRGIHYSAAPFFVIDTAFYLKPKGDLDVRWAYYQLLTVDINGMDSGSAIPSTSRDEFYKLPVVLPPRDEQEAIAGLLMLLDERIDLLRQTNATLEAIAQALFKSWFIDFDPVRAKAEGREPEGMDAATAALFPAEFEESALGLIPKGWCVASLGDVLELRKGCSYKGEGLSEADGAHMFNLGCFNAHRVFASEKVKRYTGEYRPHHAVVSGDLIIANTDMTQARDILGRPAFVPDGFEPGFISHHVFKVSTKAKEPQIAEAMRLFLFFVLQLEGFRKRAMGFATGTTVLALPASAVTECPACMPPDPALLAFADVVRPLLQRIRLNERQSDCLAQIRDTLLPRLISGKLRLPEAQERTEEMLA